MSRNQISSPEQEISLQERKTIHRMVIKNRLLKLDETLAAIMETYKKSQPYPDDPRIIEYNGVLDKFTELDQDFCQQNPSRTDAEADAELDELENAIKKFIH